MSPTSSLTTTVLLSGGLDSSTALLMALTRGERVGALFVDYGQNAASEEHAASERIALEFGVPHAVATVRGIDIPEGELMGRNAFFVLLALMTVNPPAAIVLGVHQGTHYWDCSRDFLARMQALLNGYGAGAIQLMAPFAALDKSAIHALAREHDFDLRLTYSCERAGGPCGDCLSCKDMAKLAA
jgi:7-cyano-7-deazaguanine synthase